MNPFDDIKVGDVVAYTAYPGNTVKTTVTRVLKSSFQIAAAPSSKFRRKCKYPWSDGRELGSRGYHASLVKPWSAEVEQAIKDQRAENERLRKAREIAAVNWRGIEAETLTLAYAGLLSLGIVGSAA